MCACVSRNLSVNALIIVNVWAFQSQLVFCSFRGFTGKCTRFCVDLSFLRVNVWRFFVCH